MGYLFRGANICSSYPEWHKQSVITKCGKFKSRSRTTLRCVQVYCLLKFNCIKFISLTKMPKKAAKVEDYEVLATIGSGSYGTCKKIRRKLDKKVRTKALTIFFTSMKHYYHIF